MKIQYKKCILGLLLIAFSSAALSDKIYGKADLASEYLLGQFIGQLFSVSMAFAIVLCLLWLMFRVVFRDLFDGMLRTHHTTPKETISKISKVKKGRKVK